MGAPMWRNNFVKLIKNIMSNKTEAISPVKTSAAPVEIQKLVEKHKVIAGHLETAAKHHHEASKSHAAGEHEKATKSHTVANEHHDLASQVQKDYSKQQTS